jgi:hypothetical protein
MGKAPTGATTQETAMSSDRSDRRTLSDRIIAVIIQWGGVITREQCQQLGRMFDHKNINWLFGTRHPRLRQRLDGLRELV